MQKIPVYMITGFLESGKTSFLQDIVTDEDFTEGQRCLLIVCEEGEVEYNNEDLCGNNITMITVNEEEKMNTDFLKYCIRQYTPKKIFIEMNGMWDYKWVFEWGQMDRLVLAQVITLVDGSTFTVYLNNMRSLFSNMFQYTEMVIFNRCTESMDLHSYRRTVRSLNPRAMVYFEAYDGEPIDPGAEVPPFDFDADVINIEDMDYGLWFLDASDNPERYEGKTVRFLAKVMKSRRMPEGMIVPGRNAMTCCADDIRFIGYLCKADFVNELKTRQWIYLTAKIHYEYQKDYGEEGPVLYGISYEPAEEPEDDLVYFN